MDVDPPPSALQAHFHPAALDEFTRIAMGYAGITPELGLAFAAEARRVLALATRHPGAGSPLDARGTRRFLFRRFPYVLVYRVDERALLVLALAHVRRRPGYWRGRR